jgi:hypothetical protein
MRRQSIRQNKREVKGLAAIPPPGVGGVITGSVQPDANPAAVPATRLIAGATYTWVTIPEEIVSTAIVNGAEILELGSVYHW